MKSESLLGGKSVERVLSADELRQQLVPGDGGGGVGTADLGAGSCQGHSANI